MSQTIVLRDTWATMTMVATVLILDKVPITTNKIFMNSLYQEVDIKCKAKSAEAKPCLLYSRNLFNKIYLKHTTL